MILLLEPKPFVEASVILRRGHDQSTVTHFKWATNHNHIVCNNSPVKKTTLSRYVHVLVQKMAVNVDLGFILSLVDFFSLDEENLQLEVSLF